jgi:hypothetical protein
MNDVIFDTLLKEAVAENFREKMEAMPSEEELLRENPPSAHHIRRMKAIFAMERRMKIRTPVFKVAKAAVYVVCVIAALTFALLLTNPGVRAAVREAIVTFWGKFASVEFPEAETPSKSIQDFSLQYIPEGYSLDSTVENGETLLTFYMDANGDMLILDISPPNSYAIDSEHQNYRTETVDGVVYHVFESTKSGDSTNIIWESEGFSFQLNGILSADELLRSAISLEWLE